jgi:hypothetical protein
MRVMIQRGTFNHDTFKDRVKNRLILLKNDLISDIYSSIKNIPIQAPSQEEIKMVANKDLSNPVPSKEEMRASLSEKMTEVSLLDEKTKKEFLDEEMKAVEESAATLSTTKTNAEWAVAIKKYKSSVIKRKPKNNDNARSVGGKKKSKKRKSRKSRKKSRKSRKGRFPNKKSRKKRR